MQKYAENSGVVELPDNVIRQYIDAAAVFSAVEEAKAEAAQVRGGMYWHKGPASAPGTSYLIRTTASGSEKSLGPRSEETEHIYNSFQQRKQAAESRLSGLKDKLETHRRLNRALRVGRVSPIIVKLLNQLNDSKLGEHFRVVGTHALYAYEAEAGIRFDEGALATQDIDLLWDVRRRLTFQTALQRVDNSMLGVLRKVDPSFKIRDAQKYTAVNKDGFEVDIIRREATADDPHPVRLSDNEDDFWVVQAERAQQLLDSRPFSAVIVASDGAMARMHTLDPRAFVKFKHWMSQLPNRNPLKKRRDALQANTVNGVVKTYLPHLPPD